ncbi:MAG: DivIVA domain-containing protein [Oscillibacter sp.]|jgi:cell division initiation protein|nr:DivIVA domain-containing protein [Oscillibacter sp.]
MLTPQEVSSHAFPKAVMGGYNMSAVDEFLDELTDDYTALYKENTALKAKMKVLVEKVEDYRSTEDSMRATLLTAQKMADSIVREAEQKRDAIMASAQTDARTKIISLNAETDAAAERMRMGQQELAAFIASARTACQRELDYLQQLPKLPLAEAAAAPAAQAQPAVSEIEQSILSGFDSLASKEEAPVEEVEDAPADTHEDAAPVAEEAADQPEASYPAGNPFEDGSDDPTRRINLNELKFGRNYNGANDEDDN